jgi:hypothetical protein
VKILTRDQLPANPISALKVLAYGRAAPSKRRDKPADVAIRLRARKRASRLDADRRDRSIHP